MEQKNWTHVRQLVGYHRYDTHDQVIRLNGLYRHEWRQYENFFQPTIKLAEKVRTGGHVRRVYEVARTPYDRIMGDPAVPDARKEELRAEYQSLNPAALKRMIDEKLHAIRATIPGNGGKRPRLPETTTEIINPPSLPGQVSP